MNDPGTHRMCLGELPLGSRLLVRSRTDWRSAVICRISDERITLSVASPKGRNYRLSRESDTAVIRDGAFILLKTELKELWKENYSRYDFRW